MDKNQDTSKTSEENAWSRNRIIKIGILLVLLLLPIVYLFFKTQGTPDLQQQQPIANQAPAIDLAALEKTAKENPSFDNLINLSIAYINNNLPAKSIDYLKKALELNPKSAVAYNNLGVANIMIAHYQNGIDACEKAIAIDSSFQLAKNNLKWGLDEKNKWEASIQFQEKTPENKRNVNFYVDYGMNYFKAGEYDKSIEIWSEIFLIEPNNTIALNNIGTSFMLKNQYDDAISLFKKAITLEPGNQLAKNNLAWAMDEKNKASLKK